MSTPIAVTKDWQNAFLKAAKERWPRTRAFVEYIQLSLTYVIGVGSLDGERVICFLDEVPDLRSTEELIAMLEAKERRYGWQSVVDRE